MSENPLTGPNRIVNSSEVEGKKITVYGHIHTPEQLEAQEEDIRYLMEDHDYIASEGISPVEANLSEGYSIDREELNSYNSRLLDMASDFGDTMWDPDLYNGFWHNIGFSAVTLGIQANVIYDIGKMLYQNIMEEEHSFELNRRHLLSGAAIGITGFGAGVIEPLLSRFELTEDYDEDIYPLMTSYADMREVYAAEGLRHIATELEGDVFYICGKSHANSISGYTANNTARELRQEAYDEVVPEWQKELHEWKKSDEEWVLDTVVELSD